MPATDSKAAKNAKSTKIATPRTTCPIDPEKTYNLTDFCEAAGISSPTLYRWMAHEGLKDFSTRIGDKWFITGRLFARWIESKAGQLNTNKSADDHGTMPPGSFRTARTCDGV